ncbi:GIY-YIG nuclease family protein, partial [Acidobacteria bacterium AH-259-G07]|nr:GIY-YIG nuclease family protein [Acidobacteria bacterium AH-259-G07]
KKFRASYLRGPKYLDQLVITSILEQRMTIGNFPGFNSVLLSFHMLKTLIGESNTSWITALSNVAGVYLVTDTTSGKLYVGSAYGGKGIWQRWIAYTKNGHGGNKEIRNLLRKKGANHASLFQFSLLEVCDLNSSDDYVIGRESHWNGRTYYARASSA